MDDAILDPPLFTSAPIVPPILLRAPRIGRSAARQSGAVRRGRPASFRPSQPRSRFRIADPETKAILPQGEIGVIEIRGPIVFKGYWRMPEKTEAEFHDGWFVSGDLGFIDARGYVSIVGRAKDRIISGGYNIYPAEVEAAIDALDPVLESAVIGVPCPDMGEAVVAVIVPREAGFADEAALTAALEDRLARFKRPRRMIFVDALPKNAMGKVQKTALRERHASVLAEA